MTSFVPKNSSNADLCGRRLGGPTVGTTTFGANVQQIRVLSQVAGNIAIEQNGAATSLTSGATGGTGILIAANTAQGDYFTVRGGQVLNFVSTSTRSGFVSVTEMG
jgi:hypothetical protein